jgi:hypothetical protein
MSKWDVLKGKRGAALLRVSSDKQDTDRQRAELQNFINRLTLTVGDWYEDTRSRMEAANTKKAVEFTALMERVKEGAYDYVLVLSQNRFGVLHDFQFGAFCNELLEAGCELWDTVQGRLNDPTDMGARFQTLAGNLASDKELTEKAYHSITGKVEKIKQGTTYFGGNIPYGAAVGIFDQATGRMKWRVEVLSSKRVRSQKRDKKETVITLYRKCYLDGTIEEKEGKFPAYEESDRPRYVWSEIPGRLQLVKEVFRWYAEESWSFAGIAHKLMDNGVKGYYSDCWQGVQVKLLLRNPIFIGVPTWNKSGGEAKKWEYLGGKYEPVVLHKNRPQSTKVRTSKDYLPVPEAFRLTPVIDQKTWAVVQEKIDRADTKQPAPPPRKEKLWLAGLLYCAKCGQKMSAQSAHSRHPDRYVCSTYKMHKPGGTCFANTVKADFIDGLVSRYLEEAGATATTMVESKDRPELITPLVEKFNATQRQFQEAYARMHAFNAERLPPGESTFDYRIGTYATVPVKVVKDELTDKYEVDGESQATSLDLFRCLYDQDKAGLINRRAELERKREDLYEKMKGYKSAFARKKADEEMDKLSGEVEELEGRLSRLDTAVDSSYRALLEAQANVREAAAAFKGCEARRKAETVRKVVERIVVSCTENPEARSQTPSTVVERVEIMWCDPTMKACVPFDNADTNATARNSLSLTPSARPRTPTRPTASTVPN